MGINYGNLSALLAPISSIMVAKLTLVPATRILYINAFIIMTLKAIIWYNLNGNGYRQTDEISRNISWVEMLSGIKVQ